ncbi:uncharacterized protein C2845_PM12G09990 [Panicum miliaceum]|uniref:Uncharacterized protein n=1 Tax=Panicum miliaceum TaxID=4540 RepID=A0A3L6QJX4_PANMI|nr:uncharacterized protein C2845_PM12G09990 [Panicum miliaceum]
MGSLEPSCPRPRKGRAALLVARIDPKSACRVEINVNSYFTVRDSRKEYNRGKLKYLNTGKQLEGHQWLMRNRRTTSSLLGYAEMETKFSKECKVDYVNNNISECFNNWIKDYKDLPVADLMDKTREKNTEKIYTSQEIS